MIVVAHRGCANGMCTENTVEAFRTGLAAGADGVELDLRLSKDGEIVVVHDANLHRVAGDAHRISELTAHELSEIALRHGGAIPVLQDVTSQLHAPVILDLEIKHPDVVDPLIRKLQTSAALRERCIVSSFNVSVLRAIRNVFPEVRTLWLRPRWPLPLRGRTFRKRLHELSPWGIGFPMRILTPRRVAYLKRLGFAAGAWDERGLARESRKAVALGLDLAIVRDVATAKTVST